MLTRHDYSTIGLQKGGGDDFLTFNVRARDSKLVKDVFREAVGLQDQDISIINYKDLYGGATSAAAPKSDENNYKTAQDLLEIGKNKLLEV